MGDRGREVSKLVIPVYLELSPDYSLKAIFKRPMTWREIFTFFSSVTWAFIIIVVLSDCGVSTDFLK